MKLIHVNMLCGIFFAVANDNDRTKMSSDATTETSYSEADKLVDGMDFGELCNEFECFSSPSVESTARQLALDILEQRNGNRALGTFSVSVVYKVLDCFVQTSTHSICSVHQQNYMFSYNVFPQKLFVPANTW